MRKGFAILFVLSISRLLASASVFLPGNLVVNPGFESGFAGWGGTFGYYDAPGFALEGSRIGMIIDLSSSSVGETLHQDIPTIPGARYELRFSLLSGYGRVGEYPTPGNAPVNIYWGEQYLGVVSNPSTTTWQTFDFQPTATSSSTTIEFLDYFDMHWQFLDGVSVAQIPEPQPVLLFVGAMAFGCLRRLALKDRARPWA